MDQKTLVARFKHYKEQKTKEKLMNPDANKTDEEIEFDQFNIYGTMLTESLDKITSEAKDCCLLVKDLIKEIKTTDVSLEHGLGFLEMKNQMVLTYLINLSGLVLEKVQGKSIKGSQYIDQLVEARTVLEKIRPTDIKLKYAVEKLVRQATEGKKESDPLSYRANLDDLNIFRDVGDEESKNIDSSDAEDFVNIDPEIKAKRQIAKSNLDGIYRPPKVAPQHFDDKIGSKNKTDEKFKRKKLSGTIIRELQEEFLDTPVEIHNMGDAYAKQLSRETRDKQTYEETYMTRLPITKADKHKEKSFSTLGVLGDELTDFSGKSKSGGGGGKKRKLTGKGKSKGRGGKKKFRK